MAKSNNPISKISFELPEKTYALFFFLIAISGLNIQWINTVQIFQVISPVRIGWIALLLLFAIGLTKKKPPNIILFIYIPLGLWVGLHLINSWAFSNANAAILTRIVQAVFIATLIGSISTRQFKLERFCLALNPLFPAIAGVLIVLILVTNVEFHDLYLLLRDTIIGSSSNFSIFCAQLVSFFLVRDLVLNRRQERPTVRSICTLSLLIIPFVSLQIISGGRAGVVLTLIAICAYGISRDGLRGLLFSVVHGCGLIIAIERFLTMFPFFFTNTKNLLLETGASVSGQKGIFRNLDQLFMHFQSPNVQTIGDIFTAGRLEGLRQTLQAINSKMLTMGYGVNNFKVNLFDGQHFPHVELLRYLLELGIAGALIPAIIYSFPFVKLLLNWRYFENKLALFSSIYMAGVLATTLFQPSGPLTHLNNSILFWMLFGHFLSLRPSEDSYHNNTAKS